MAFIDYRLNDRYRVGFVGGPRWNTQIITLRSGREQRIAQWAMPHREYTADFAALNDAEKQEFLSVLMATRGARDDFRFKDWNDWQADNEVFGIGDGTSSAKQLSKTYVWGPASYTRPITLPLSAVVSADGMPIDVTVNALTGMVTPDDPWPNGAVLTWSGQFDVRVRFANDFNPFTSVASSIRELPVTLIETLP